MSDDPETLRQIEELAKDERPLLILDVDDVVLDFIRPFPRYLAGRGYRLRMDSFHLHGNIVDSVTGEPLEATMVTELVDAFFVDQAEWQSITEGAADALKRFGSRAEIIMLTQMPHRHRASRRAHFDALGLHYPLLTTEMPKGPAIKRLRGETRRPVAFVDDQPRNLVSALDAVPDAFVVHLMADTSIRYMLPEPPPGAVVVEDWAEATPLIAEALGI